MRRLLPLVALVVTLLAVPDALAANRAVAVASLPDSGQVAGTMVLRERPGTIGVHALFAIDNTVADGPVRIAARPCSSNAPGRQLTLGTGDFAAPGSELRTSATTPSDRLVLPRAHSVRLFSGDTAVACAPLLHLRKGKHPTVAVGEVSGAFDGILFAQQRSLVRADYCGDGIVAPPPDQTTGRAAFVYQKIDWTLLSKSGAEVLSLVITLAESHADEFRFSGTTDTERNAVARARRLRVTGDQDAPMTARPARYVVAGDSFPVCGHTAAASATPQARAVASFHEVGHPVGLLSARETPGTIKAHLMLELDEALPDATIALFQGGCSGKPGRHLTLTSGDLAAPGEDLHVRMDTGLDTLVLPHVRSLRIASGGEQVVCAPVVLLRKGRHPNVTLSDAIYAGESGGLNEILVTVGRATSCGMAHPTSANFNPKEYSVELLAKAGRTLASGLIGISSAVDVVDYVVTPSDDQARLSLGRKLRVHDDGEIFGVKPVGRYVAQSAISPLCGGW
jgi:hypothetical protein